MDLKKVVVSRMVRKKLDESPWFRYELEPVGEALFHQFGVGYEEFKDGPGNFTTAIVEWPDGRVESVVADNVQFVTPNVRAEAGPTAKRHARDADHSLRRFAGLVF